MKTITIAGNIGNHAEFRTTNGGDKFATFSVAVDDGFGDKKRTLWFDVTVWGKRAEVLAPMLPKGGKVCVSGDLSTREHEGKTYLTVRAAEVTLMSPRQDRDAPRDDRPPSGADRGSVAAYHPPMTRAEIDDEIPF